MARNRFVAGSTKKFDLPKHPDDEEQDWIEIKTELTYGEEQRLAGIGVTSYRPLDDDKGELGVDWGVLGVEKIAMYLVSWSFKKPNGDTAPCDKNSIRNLTQETADEILDIINQHEADQEALKNSGTAQAKGKTTVNVTVGSKS